MTLTIPAAQARMAVVQRILAGDITTPNAAASALAEVGRIHPGAVSAAEFSILADAADWTVAHNRTMVAFRRSSLVADRHTTRSELF